MSSALPPDIAVLVKQTRQRLGLSQTEFANRLGVSFHSVNRWENRQVRPLPLALKQIEALLHQMGEQGEDLLTEYFQPGAQ